MNKNIFNAFIVGSLAMGLASCSENSWNDHYLDGFEGGVDYDDAVEGTYALTAADYSSIASIMQGRLRLMKKSCCQSHRYKALF